MGQTGDRWQNSKCFMATERQRNQRKDGRQVLKSLVNTPFQFPHTLIERSKRASKGHPKTWQVVGLSSRHLFIDQQRLPSDV